MISNKEIKQNLPSCVAKINVSKCTKNLLEQSKPKIQEAFESTSFALKSERKQTVVVAVVVVAVIIFV